MRSTMLPEQEHQSISVRPISTKIHDGQDLLVIFEGSTLIWKILSERRKQDAYIALQNKQVNVNLLSMQ